jgi:DNA-binding NarL/FixJ family response regulator
VELNSIVVEDDAFMRMSIARALESRGWRVVGCFGSCSDALDAVPRARIDVAVLDLHLGEGPNGMDLARSIRRMSPHTGIVILTSYSDPRMLGSQGSLPSGTQYVVKAMVDSIDDLEVAMRRSMRARVSSSNIPESSKDFGKLTNVQMETLRLVADGHSNTEIARVRSVSVKSIENTIRRICSSLNVEYSSTQNQRVHLAKLFFEARGLPIA